MSRNEGEHPDEPEPELVEDGLDPQPEEPEGPEPEPEPEPAAIPLTLTIELPVERHETPEDEAQLALGEIVATPASLPPAAEPGLGGIGTLTVEVVPDLVRAADEEVVPTVAAAPVVPLPGDEELRSRRERKRGAAAPTAVAPEPAAPPAVTPPVASAPADERGGAGSKRRPAPEGAWPALVYASTLHLVNLGDSRPVRERKELEARIAKPLEGGTRFVPVLTRKGGVGKTTITTLLGMALSSVREDRVIAVDANPDRGTLSERVAKQTRSTVRDIVERAPAITGFEALSAHVSRDESRLDVLASDTDPSLSEAFDEDDYNVVADLVSRHYAIVLTDCGTGIVHSVMRATLQRADEIVVVSGGSIDEARLASETLTWLEANDYGHLVRNAVVAINTATHGTSLVKLDEIDAHFRSRVREVVRMPYDPELAAGSVVRWSRLKPFTRASARDLAAHVMDGLPTTRSA